MPQLVVYKPSPKGRQDTIAHWLGPDDTTFCGHDLKHTLGWEPHDGSPYRMCGRCMRSAGVQERRGESRPCRVGHARSGTPHNLG